MGRLQKQFTTKVSLASLKKQYGELWAEAYLEIAPLTIKALPELRGMKVDKSQGEELNSEQMDSILPMLKKAFIGGKVVLNGKLVDAEADDMDDLPLQGMNAVITAAVGEPDPKA
jgi:hypothetical protein